MQFFRMSFVLAAACVLCLSWSAFAQELQAEVDGTGTSRFSLATGSPGELCLLERNEFYIVGPAADPARIADAASVAAD